MATKVPKELEEPERGNEPCRGHGHRQQKTKLVVRSTSRVGKRSGDSADSASLRHTKTSARHHPAPSRHPTLGRVRGWLPGGTNCGMSGRYRHSRTVAARMLRWAKWRLWKDVHSLLAWVLVKCGFRVFQQLTIFSTDSIQSTCPSR